MMKFFRFIFRNFNWGMHLFTPIKGKKVGQDAFGNRYFVSRCQSNPKRWVMYKGYPDPTKVPPQWHSWLHYMDDKIPSEILEKDAQSDLNLTGTKLLYTPKNTNSSPKYTPWNPNS